VIVPLKGGGSAELRDTLAYGPARAIRAAMLAAKADPSYFGGVEPAFVSAYLVSLNGQPMTPETIDLVPDEVMAQVVEAAVDLWKGTPKTPPKGGRRRSRTTPLVQP
jgi:hypothetical protein